MGCTEDHSRFPNLNLQNWQTASPSLYHQNFYNSILPCVNETIIANAINQIKQEEAKTVGSFLI